MHNLVKVAAVISLVAFLIFGISITYGVSNQDAATAIGNAEHALEVAFAAVSNAESSGVNVSRLLNRLNEAGMNLTFAEAAMYSSNYSEAVNLANACSVNAEAILEDAVTMKSKASGWSPSFLSALESGLLGSGVFIVGLVGTWIWFKRYYKRKLSTSVPEVT